MYLLQVGREVRLFKVALVLHTPASSEEIDSSWELRNIEKGGLDGGREVQGLTEADHGNVKSTNIEPVEP